LARAAPGITTFFFVALLVILGVAMSLYMVFSPHLYYMQDYGQTLITFGSKDIFNSKEFETLVMQPANSFYSVLGLLTSWV